MPRSQEPQDMLEENSDAHQDAGYQFSGGGPGQKSVRSLARDTDEALERVNGPYTRAGQPAIPSREADHSAEHEDDGFATPASKVADAAKNLKELDEKRPNFPGEHLVVFAAGILLLWGAGKRRSALTRMVMTAAGGALVGRAASGTGGVAKVAGFLSRK